MVELVFRNRAKLVATELRVVMGVVCLVNDIYR